MSVGEPVSGSAGGQDDLSCGCVTEREGGGRLDPEVLSLISEMMSQ